MLNEEFDIIDIHITFMLPHGSRNTLDARGISSSGRALDLHSRGTGIDTRILHFSLYSGNRRCFDARGVSLGFCAQYVVHVWYIIYRLFRKTAETRDWTRDLQIFSLTLSQLSYLGCATWALVIGAMAMYHSNTHIKFLLRMWSYHYLRSNWCTKSMDWHL